MRALTHRTAALPRILSLTACAMLACNTGDADEDITSVVEVADPIVADADAPGGSPPDYVGGDDPSDGAHRVYMPRGLAADAPVGDDDIVYRDDAPLHTIMLRTPAGAERTVVQEIDGYLVAEGDMVVGTVDDLVAPEDEGALHSLVVLGTGPRWGSIVPYELSAALASQTTQNIEAALDYVEQRTSVRFVRRDGESDHIRFVPSTDTNASRAEVGRKGGRQYAWIWMSHGVGTIAHEIMHSLGFRHEQGRIDRNDFVSINDSCIRDDKAGNYGLYLYELMLSRYDFSSIMHYSSRTFCKTKPDSNTCIDDPDTGLPCLTMTAKPYRCSPNVCTDADGDGISETIPNSGTMSRSDINGVFLTNARNLGGHETDDNFGQAVAVGDFDRDGIDDLAVGAPFEAPGTDPASGVVFLYKGTHRGLTPWRWISQETRGVQADGSLGAALDDNSAWERFGASLTVGDFNGDGIDDLAVGAPGEDVSGFTDAGAVYVYLGFPNANRDPRFGLQPWRELTQQNSGFGADEALDVFGTALAAGDIDGDGIDELVVGAPGEAPGSSPRSGFVFIYRGAENGLFKWKGLTQGSLSPLAEGERFGASLATADLDDDGRADVIVGSPGEQRGGMAAAGAAFVFRGGAVEPSPWTLLDESALGTYAVGDEFGTAIAAGDLDGDGIADLGISSPFGSGGRVYLFRGSSAAVIPWKKVSQSGLGGDEAGDLFGAALAIDDLDFDGYADLVVGGPGERVGGGPAKAGYVFTFRGGPGGVSAWTGLGHGGMASPIALDSLGGAIAIGAFSDVPWRSIAAGVAGRTMEGHIRAGAVFLYVRDGASPREDRAIHQGTKAELAP